MLRMCVENTLVRKIAIITMSMARATMRNVQNKTKNSVTHRRRNGNERFYLSKNRLVT